MTLMAVLTWRMLAARRARGLLTLWRSPRELAVRLLARLSHEIR
jgi:hypothetical protein